MLAKKPFHIPVLDERDLVDSLGVDDASAALDLDADAQQLPPSATLRSDPLAHWVPVLATSAGDVMPTRLELCEYGTGAPGFGPPMCTSTSGSGRCPNFAGLSSEAPTRSLCTGNLLRRVPLDLSSTKIQ